MIFIDDYNHFTWIYFLCPKVEVFTIFQTFMAYILGYIFLHVLQFYDLIIAENICHMTKKIFCNRMVLYLNNTVPYFSTKWLAERKNK